MQPTYFSGAAQFRRWLARHGATETELLVGFHKTGSGTPSMSWPESVDQALCYGWIDGVRRRIDAARYSIRFTPRKAVSTWSVTNIGRVAVLTERKLMQPAGLAAFAARRENRSGIYSYEQRPRELPAQYQSRLAENKQALLFFDAQPASYRVAAIWWVVSAKQEATRLKRLAMLIEDSLAARRIKQFTVRKPGVK